MKIELYFSGFPTATKNLEQNMIKLQKHELGEMQERINDSERRNHELSSSIQSATRPLLRQIENLQMTNSNQSESFETLEKQLNCRIQELQESLAAQQESDRSARETVAEVKGQFKALQSAKQTALEEKQQIKQEYVNTKDEHDKENFYRNKV